MKKTLFLGFKGQNNSSAIMVNSLSGERSLLTNSFSGLKRDIDMLSKDYDEVYLFGADKSLTDSFRIEECAQKENAPRSTSLDLKRISDSLSAHGVKSTILAEPTYYLCNEAYWYLLEKYDGRAVLIHIPTIKHFKLMEIKI